MADCSRVSVIGTIPRDAAILAVAAAPEDV